MPRVAVVAMVAGAMLARADMLAQVVMQVLAGVRALALVLQAKVLLLVAHTKVLHLNQLVLLLAGFLGGAVTAAQIVILNVTKKKTRTASKQFCRKGDLLYNIHIAKQKGV
jgi:hypothetical protein